MLTELEYPTSTPGAWAVVDSEAAIEAMVRMARDTVDRRNMTVRGWRQILVIFDRSPSERWIWIIDEHLHQWYVDKFNLYQELVERDTARKTTVFQDGWPRHSLKSPILFACSELHFTCVGLRNRAHSRQPKIDHFLHFRPRKRHVGKLWASAGSRYSDALERPSRTPASCPCD
jgi:hypothetical protein